MSEAPLVGRRISIRGTSGSGKSTLARQLSERLNLPHTELDGIFHMPNWESRPTEDFRRIVSEAVARDVWVIDGNYSKVYDLILDRADTVIWLEFPLPVVLWRLTRRTFRRGLFREELWNGNRESLWRHLFTRESLYLWVLQTNGKRHRQAEEFFSSPSNEGLIRHRFRRPADVKRWLASLPDLRADGSQNLR